MIELGLKADVSKHDAVDMLREAILRNEYEIVDEDTKKPWGAYFRFAHDQGGRFVKEYFQGYKIPKWAKKLPLDPKLLLIAPGQRNSWQYHERRAEIWKVVTGPVNIFVSKDDELPKAKSVRAGQTIEVKFGMRHRFEGENGWGLIAEIWVHKDKSNLSEESDIIRLEDDFGRK